MRQASTAVSAHPLVKLSSLAAVGVLSAGLAWIMTKNFDSTVLQTTLATLVGAAIVASAYGCLTSFRTRFFWSYDGIEVRKIFRSYFIDQDCITAIVVDEGSVSSHGWIFNFHRFTVHAKDSKGRQRRVTLDFLMQKAMDAKGFANQWVLVRPKLLTNTTVADFIDGPERSGQGQEPHRAKSGVAREQAYQKALKKKR